MWPRFTASHLRLLPRRVCTVGVCKIMFPRPSDPSNGAQAVQWMKNNEKTSRSPLPLDSSAHYGSSLSSLPPPPTTQFITRSTLKLLKTERVKQYDYCLPYFQPLKADDNDEDTVVNIMFPLEPPIVCDFDWELDDLEDFTNDLIKDEVLSEDQKDAFQDYVKEQVRETKKTQKQAREARRKAIEDMDPETKAAFENMRFYKFYPVQTPDTPDISSVKVPYINRYYGKAHVVM